MSRGAADDRKNSGPHKADDVPEPSVVDAQIRAAEPNDVELLHQFVVALARDEEFPGAVTSTPDSLRIALFGDVPIAHAVLVEREGTAVGFALYYFAYSTILGLPTLHLEDLYVTDAHRGLGVGLHLLKHLAGVAVDSGCGRFEWWVLRTNVDAVRFYQRLGARDLDEIDVMRLDGQALKRLAVR